MVRRKLQALSYAEYKNFSCNDEKQFRSLILWLEDQKIRHYRVEDRSNLRELNSQDWPKAFAQYCKDVICPIKSNERNAILEWLLSFAIRLEFSDEVDKYKNHSAEAACQQKTAEPSVKCTNPLDKLDFESEEFKNGVNELARALKVATHPNHLVTLEAVCLVILDNINYKPSPENKGGTAFPIMESDLGFDLGDYILNQAAKVLRLLHIHEMRDLQTGINECIVAVQQITANPKTDTKLGKVGF